MLLIIYISKKITMIVHFQLYSSHYCMRHVGELRIRHLGQWACFGPVSGPNAKLPLMLC